MEILVLVITAIVSFIMGGCAKSLHFHYSINKKNKFNKKVIKLTGDNNIIAGDNLSIDNSHIESIKGDKQNG